MKLTNFLQGRGVSARAYKVVAHDAFPDKPAPKRWVIVLSRVFGTERAEFDFHAGSMWKGDPIEEFLECVLSDTKLLEGCYTFRDWSDYHGMYEKDSLKGSQVFDACREQASKLRVVCGWGTFADFLRQKTQDEVDQEAEHAN